MNNKKRDSSHFNTDHSEEENGSNKRILLKEYNLDELKITNENLLNEKEQLLKELEELKKMKNNQMVRSKPIAPQIPKQYRFPENARSGSLFFITCFADKNIKNHNPSLFSISYFTETCAMLLGYKPKDLIGQPYSMIYPTFANGIMENVGKVK